MRDMTMLYGREASLTANAFYRNGYSFGGWSESATSTTVKFTDGQTVNNLTTRASEVIALYAIWNAETYTVTYNANGGDITQNGTASYTITSTVTLPVATRRGYSLSGWTPVATVGNWVALENYTGTVNAGKYGNVELKAQWSKISYEITWAAAGSLTRRRI